MYNFDKIENRRNTNSFKWDIKANELPMWVADMDFQTAPKIKEAILKKAEQGIFAYTIIPDEYYELIKTWLKNQEQAEIQKSWILHSNGTIPAISSLIRALSKKEDNIIIQPPIYGVFYNSILNNHRKVLENPLIYKDYNYTIDFADLEKKLADKKTKILLLCNPHNPIGKIWSFEDLERIAKLCKKYEVIIIADEIHCDIRTVNSKFHSLITIPYFKDLGITIISPSKAFNLAGLQSASVIIENQELREKIKKSFNADEINEANFFAIEATMAAYRDSKDWLLELNNYLTQNKNFAINFLNTYLPQIKVNYPEASYLLWLDCRTISEDSKKLQLYLRETTGLILSSGTDFGKNGEGFLRMNLAAPKEIIIDGLNRFKNGIKNYLEDF